MILIMIFFFWLKRKIFFVLEFQGGGGSLSGGVPEYSRVFWACSGFYRHLAERHNGKFVPRCMYTMQPHKINNKKLQSLSLTLLEDHKINDQSLIFGYETTCKPMLVANVAIIWISKTRGQDSSKPLSTFHHLLHFKPFCHFNHLFNWTKQLFLSLFFHFPYENPLVHDITANFTWPH